MEKEKKYTGYGYHGGGRKSTGINSRKNIDKIKLSNYYEFITIFSNSYRIAIKKPARGNGPAFF